MVERKEINVPEVGQSDDYFEYLVIKMYIEKGDKLTPETLKKYDELKLRFDKHEDI